MTLYLSLFVAGILTILLPCILPLIPVVVGVSVTGRNPWRPLLVVLGMVISFVFFTVLLLVVLKQFVELANIIRIAMFVALLLFGFAFASEHRSVRIVGALVGGLFFYDQGWFSVVVAAVLGVLAFDIGARIASRIQQTGLVAQQVAKGHFGADSPLTALCIGLTLGLIWVPCAGPALGFALTLVRDEPGLQAILALTCYALGTALPLLIIGYGGQKAVHSVRALSPYTGVIKRGAGLLLILTALALQFHVFENIQIYLLEHTSFGSIGTSLEESLFKNTFNPSAAPSSRPSSSTSFSSSSSVSSLQPSVLPTISRAPEFSDLTPWHNSPALTMKELRGKVVLVDFWTYSCINCIRTLPYIQGYWDKFKDTGKFVIVAVHAPEFTFEKSEKNVAMAIQEHGLTYPVAQDNNFSTWSAFANHYWPAKYLIDANGYIRYTHFGEGNYEETDRAIQSLLGEIGVQVNDKTIAERRLVQRESGGSMSPETYLSSRSWPALGNALGDPSGAILEYVIPNELVLNKYYLSGTWQLMNDEAETLRSPVGEIRMKFTGGEINLVMGLEENAKPVKAQSFIDGKLTKEFTVDHHDLYPLFSGANGEHELRLVLSSPGVQTFAFTFGQ